MVSTKNKNKKKTGSANVLITNNDVSSAPSQHIKMIFEGSCDTEDWSDENSALQFHPQTHIS